MRHMRAVTFLLILSVLQVSCTTEEDHGVKYANRCEICKILAIELQERLDESGKTHNVIETGYSLDDVKPKKRTKYNRSELRLVESLEDVCEQVLEYNLHKDRSDSTRFAKGMSQTFKALHGLVDKGVKVELGIPYELWDKPPVEVTHMKTQCEHLLENYETHISDWYFKKQNEISLVDYLCANQVLKPDERQCLTEKESPAANKSNEVQSKKKRKLEKKRGPGPKGDTYQHTNTDHTEL